MSKISKTVQPCFGDLASWVKLVTTPSRKLTQQLLATLWQVKAPVTKKTQKNFKNLGFQNFHDWFTSGSSSHEFYSDYLATPISTHLRVELLVAKNTQKNFSKFFSWGFWRLVRDLFQLQKSCVLHFKDSFQRLFNFPSFIVLPVHLSHKLTVFL